MGMPCIIPGQVDNVRAFTLMRCRARYPSAILAGRSEHTLVNTPLLDFGHGAGARIQGLDFVLGHKSGHRVPVSTQFL